MRELCPEIACEPVTWLVHLPIQDRPADVPVELDHGSIYDALRAVLSLADAGIAEPGKGEPWGSAMNMASALAWDGVSKNSMGLMWPAISRVRVKPPAMTFGRADHLSRVGAMSCPIRTLRPCMSQGDPASINALCSAQT
jgi:hypothetical protein